MIIYTLVLIGLGILVCLWAIIGRRRAFEVSITCGYAEKEQQASHGDMRSQTLESLS